MDMLTPWNTKPAATPWSVARRPVRSPMTTGQGPLKRPPSRESVLLSGRGPLSDPMASRPVTARQANRSRSMSGDSDRLESAGDAASAVGDAGGAAGRGAGKLGKVARFARFAAPVANVLDLAGGVQDVRAA